MEICSVLIIPSEFLLFFFFFFLVKNGEHYENKNIWDLIPVMVITKTKLALEKPYFLIFCFGFDCVFFTTSATGL